MDVTIDGVPPTFGSGPKLLAVSDLHVAQRGHRELLADLWPGSSSDWLLVAGDVADLTPDIEWALGLLSHRFAKVIWTPGNHELWTCGRDPVQLRGDDRYRYLVDLCRTLGVVTPEDPYPVWEGDGGPVVIVPVFTLYDYSFIPRGASTSAEGLALAYETGVVCTDEVLLHPDPYPSRQAWCDARVMVTQRRLAQLQPGVPVILMSHFPLIRELTDPLRYPEFVQWCGTTRTAGWHRAFNVAAVVYGHLHIPRTSWHDGVRFEEVSVRETGGIAPREILPAVAARATAGGDRHPSASGNGHLPWGRPEEAGWGHKPRARCYSRFVSWTRAAHERGGFELSRRRS